MTPAFQTATGRTSPGGVRLVVDGRPVRAPEGATLLQAARAAGILIPTLCHHEALEPSGACRLCVVDVARPGQADRWTMVAACLHPVEEGLRVHTASDRVRAARREILALLLARAPESPAIRTLAREYGIEETPYRKNPRATACILCGLCTRMCDHLGPSAISLLGRGIGREVAPPFDEPPPDCIGCLACAEICPTGHIPWEQSETGRRIWGRQFTLLRCPTCGRGHLTEAQADFLADRHGMSRADLAVCDACKRTVLGETIVRLGVAG